MQKGTKKKRGHPLKEGKTQKKSQGVRTQKRKERGSRRNLQGEQVKSRKKGQIQKEGSPKRKVRGRSQEKRAAPAEKKNPCRGDCAEKKKGQRQSMRKRSWKE